MARDRKTGRTLVRGTVREASDRMVCQSLAGSTTSTGPNFDAYAVNKINAMRFLTVNT
jgi:hypothetical protein